MSIRPVSEDRWRDAHAQAVAGDTGITKGGPASFAYLRAKGNLPETFYFKTREGGMGILQIVGFTDDPKGVKIRYKMIQRVTKVTRPIKSISATETIEEKAELIRQGRMFTAHLTKTVDMEVAKDSFRKPNVTLDELCQILDSCSRVSPEKLQADLRAGVSPSSATASPGLVKCVSDGTRMANRTDTYFIAYDGEKETTYLPSDKSAKIHANKTTHFVGLQKFYLDVSRTLESHGESTTLTITSKMLHGETMECVELFDKESGRKRRELWIDAENGYVPRRLVTYNSKGKVKWFYEADCVAEYGAHLLLPTYAMQAYFAGKDTPDHIFTYVIRGEPIFNEAIDPEEFDPHFPVGTVVTDHRFVPPRQYVVGAPAGPGEVEDVLSPE